MATSKLPELERIARRACSILCEDKTELCVQSCVEALLKAEWHAGIKEETGFWAEKVDTDFRIAYEVLSYPAGCFRNEIRIVAFLTVPEDHAFKG